MAKAKTTNNLRKYREKAGLQPSELGMMLRGKHRVSGAAITNYELDRRPVKVESAHEIVYQLNRFTPCSFLDVFPAPYKSLPELSPAVRIAKEQAEEGE